jgi:hypothetical protein
VRRGSIGRADRRCIAPLLIGNYGAVGTFVKAQVLAEGQAQRPL